MTLVFILSLVMLESYGKKEIMEVSEELTFTVAYLRLVEKLLVNLQKTN
jgi:hypothetical protein